MNSRKWLVIGVIIVALLVLPVVWYLASPLFINNAVDETFPFEMPEASAMDGMSEADKMALEEEFMTAVPDEDTLNQLTDAELEQLESDVLAAADRVMTDKEIADPMPEAAAEWTAVASGTFSGADDFHQGSGTATIYQQGDQRVLRFEEFEVTNGPDLHVILTRNPNPTSRADVGEDYIDLGAIKGNLGNQNYDIPADVDLSQYQGVVIYCVPFHVVFATAELTP